MARETRDPRQGYHPPVSVSYGVIPLLGGMVGVLLIGFVGIIDRIPGFGASTSIPLTDLALYAAIAFAAGFVLLLIKAVIWPW